MLSEPLFTKSGSRYFNKKCSVIKNNLMSAVDNPTAANDKKEAESYSALEGLHMVTLQKIDLKTFRYQLTDLSQINFYDFAKIIFEKLQSLQFRTFVSDNQVADSKTLKLLEQEIHVPGSISGSTRRHLAVIHNGNVVLFKKQTKQTGIYDLVGVYYLDKKGIKKAKNVLIKQLEALFYEVYGKEWNAKKISEFVKNNLQHANEKQYEARISTLGNQTIFKDGRQSNDKLLILIFIVLNQLLSNHVESSSDLNHIDRVDGNVVCGHVQIENKLIVQDITDQKEMTGLITQEAGDYAVKLLKSTSHEFRVAALSNLCFEDLSLMIDACREAQKNLMHKFVFGDEKKKPSLKLANAWLDAMKSQELSSLEKRNVVAAIHWLKNEFAIMPVFLYSESQKVRCTVTAKYRKNAGHVFFDVKSCGQSPVRFSARIMLPKELILAR